MVTAEERKAIKTKFIAKQHLFTLHNNIQCGPDNSLELIHTINLDASTESETQLFVLFWNKIRLDLTSKRKSGFHLFAKEWNYLPTYNPDNSASNKFTMIKELTIHNQDLLKPILH